MLLDNVYIRNYLKIISLYVYSFSREPTILLLFPVAGVTGVQLLFQTSKQFMTQVSYAITSRLYIPIFGRSTDFLKGQICVGRLAGLLIWEYQIRLGQFSAWHRPINKI